MSLVLGELVGYITADDGQFTQALDASDRRMVRFQAATGMRLADLERTFGVRGRGMGQQLRSGLSETLADFHPAVQVDADARPADERVAQLFRRIEALRARIDVDVPPEDALAEVGEIRDALQLLSQRHADPQVRVQAANAATTLESVRAMIAEVDATDPHVQVDVDAAEALAELHEVDRAQRNVGSNDGPRRAAGLFGRLSSAVMTVLGPLGSVLGRVGAMGAGFGAAVPIAAGLVATVEQLAPAAAVAVTGLLAVLSVTAALKLGMSGVGDAVKAAFDPKTKPDALKKALDGLAPSARAFVEQLRAMKPQFDGLRLGVQGTLFAGLAGHVRDLGLSVLPVLRGQLTHTADTLNIMAKSVTDTAASLADDGTLGKALSGANRGLRNLAGVPAQVVNALAQVATAAAPSFDRLTAKAADVAGKISNRLDNAFQSGAMEQAINTAVALFGQLGHVLGNVGTIISNVFAAAGNAGGGLVGILGTVTDALAKATSMPGVQAALGDLFEVMGEIGRVAGPLLVQIFAALGPVITTLAPPLLRLIDSLGAGLQPIITALGPVLAAAAGAVGQLLDAVSPILPIIGQMIASLGPVLTPILQIVGDLFASLAPPLLTLGKALLPPFVMVMKTLGTAFRQLAPVIATALQQLGTKGLTPVITGIAKVVSELVTKYSGLFLRMFQQLLPVIPLLVPVLIQLGQSIGQILVAVAPLVPQLMLLATQFITAVLPAIIPLIGPITQLTLLLTRLATWAITKVVIPVLGFLVDALGALKKGFQPAIDAVTWLTKTISGAFEWLYDHLVGHSVIPDMVRSIVAWFAGLPGKALNALAGIAKKLGGAIEDAATSMIQATITGLKAVVSWIGDLPDRAVTALGDLATTLYKSGQHLIGGFIDGIKSMGKSVGDAASSVLSFAKDHFPNSPAKRGPFSGRGWTMYSGIATAMDFAAGLHAQRGAVGQAARALMATAHDGLSGGAFARQSAMAGSLAVSAPLAGGSSPVSNSYDNRSYNYNLSMKPMTKHEFDAWRQRDEMMARVGRAR